MKKLFALVLAMGFAFATCGGGTTSQQGEAWDISTDCEQNAQVSETITVDIPVRYALHLTETVWALDLREPPRGHGIYTLDPNDPVAPNEGCYLVPKTVTDGAALKAYLLGGGKLRPIDTYPAIKDYNDDGHISDKEKGTLICVNHKILQKFSNSPDGWKLTVSVNAGNGSPTSGFGYFGLADRILPAGDWAYFYTNTLPVSNQVVAKGSGTTGGWLDDDIVEAFWFDGSEVAGTYELDVTFTLAALNTGN